MQLIAFVNKSTLVTDSDVAKMAAAISFQLVNDVCPKYGFEPCFCFPCNDPPETVIPQLVFFDDADQADALGYHELAPNGLPYAKVFVNTTNEDGGIVSLVASHEAIEMLVDPNANAFRSMPSGSSLAFEACDPVQGAPLYSYAGIQLSNFVLPAYFDIGSAGPWDYLGVLKGPQTVAPGGYQILKLPDGSYTEVFGHSMNRPNVANRGARRERLCKENQAIQVQASGTSNKP